MNFTYIVFIPKEGKVSSFGNLRPISLCNLSYKILSKLIANRLRPFLDRFISSSQVAFVTGKWISENSILTHEIGHCFKKKLGKGGLIGVKVDMAKAYDSLEWSFIVRVMEVVGFDKVFCNLILQCISTTSFSLLINGSAYGSFKAERGIRQGDPLSPYLFIICAEVLSRLLVAKEREGSILGSV